jgi:hypothetical protein
MVKATVRRLSPMSKGQAVAAAGRTDGAEFRVGGLCSL